MHRQSMATNNFEDYDEINDAILLQAEDGRIYLPGSADSPIHQSHILPDLGAGLAPLTKPSSQAVLSTTTEGRPGLSGSEASGMARTSSCPPPHAESGTAPSDLGCHTGEQQPMDVNRLLLG